MSSKNFLFVGDIQSIVEDIQPIVSLLGGFCNIGWVRANNEFKKTTTTMQNLECALKWDCYKLSINTKLIYLIWDFSNVFLLLFMIDLKDILFNSWKG